MSTGDALFLGAAIALSLMFSVIFIAAGKPFGGWVACLGVSMYAAAALSERGKR